MIINGLCRQILIYLFFLAVHKQGVIFPTEYIVGTTWDRFGYDGIEVCWELVRRYLKYVPLKFYKLNSVVDGRDLLFGENNWSQVLGDATRRSGAWFILKINNKHCKIIQFFSMMCFCVLCTIAQYCARSQSDNK